MKQVSRHCWTLKTWSSCGNPTGSVCSRTYRRSTDDSTTTHDPSNLRTSNDGNASCFIVQLRPRMQFAKKLLLFYCFYTNFVKKKYIYFKSSRTPLYFVDSSLFSIYQRIKERFVPI